MPPDDLDMTLDPVEMLNQALERVWFDLCCTYDATGELPTIKTLFHDANLSRPFQAAKMVLANMLLEVMESIGRFSPWYTRPARAFGLASIRDPVNDQTRWMLAPEAVCKWQHTLDRLAEAIQGSYSLIEAMILVDGLMDAELSDDPLVVARCACTPPRCIHITKSVLIKAEIMCDACLQPFV